jgi:endonuclease/exonuclease/phosphatase family metal-dependent hydrolase
MQFRVATFNLENLDDGRATRPPLGARLPTLRAQLQRLQADVLCLQEVNAQELGPGKQRRLDALDQLLADTIYEGFTRVWTKDKHNKGALDVHNLVILSRHAIRAHSQLWHDLVPPPIYRLLSRTHTDAMTSVRWDRPLLHAEIDIGGGLTLHIINVHLRAPRAAFIPGRKDSASQWNSVGGWAEGLLAAAMKHCGQALEVRLLVDYLFDADSGAMIAVCGDFNADAAETPVRMIRGDPEDIGNKDLSARVLAALENSPDEPARYSVVHGPRRIMLDHILVSRSLALRCRKIAIDHVGLLDETEPAALSGRRPGSYHAPVVVEFDLADTSGGVSA